MRNGVAHMEIFEEALNAKYFGIGKPYGRAEFDKWFADYDVSSCPCPEQQSSLRSAPECLFPPALQAIVEIPAVFLEEMVAAYPNARFVHVERDVDKWYRSIMNTLGHSLRAVDEFPMKQLRLFDNYIDKFCSFHLMVRRLWWHGRELEDGEEVLKRDYIELCVALPITPLTCIFARLLKSFETATAESRRFFPRTSWLHSTLRMGSGGSSCVPPSGVPYRMCRIRNPTRRRGSRRSR